MRTFALKSGLSLFELLLALALLALIGAGLASALGLGVQLNNRSLRLSEGATEIAARIRLRAMIETAASPTLLASFPVAFEGNDNSFSFTTIAFPEIFPESAALRTAVHVEGDVLIMEVSGLGDDGEELTRVSETLARTTGQFSFSYFNSATSPAEWQSEWENQTYLPTLVTISTSEDSVPMWPEFTVRLIMAESHAEGP